MSSTVKFWKLQSIGNDFPLIHAEDFSGDLAKLTITMCDRRFGVGGDGLLVLARNTSPELALRMFNPDGTEDFCGNGIRCAATHARQVGWVGDDFEMTHLGHLVKVHFDGDQARTDIGSASYEQSLVPLRPGSDPIFQAPVYWDEDRKILGSALTTGSTHVVVPVDRLPDDDYFLAISPKIEHFELYPERTSLIWEEVVAPGHLRIRIWERGVGETLGCGSGSSAAAADYVRRGYQGKRVQLDNPGGTVFVEMNGWDQPITIEGRAEAVFDGEFNYPSN